MHDPQYYYHYRTSKFEKHMEDRRPLRNVDRYKAYVNLFAKSEKPINFLDICTAVAKTNNFQDWEEVKKLPLREFDLLMYEALQLSDYIIEIKRQAR